MRLAGGEKARPCPVCGGAAGRTLAPLHYLMWRDLNMDGGAALAACKRCGMVFNAPRDPEAAFDRYYAGHGYYAVTDTAGAGALNAQEAPRYRRTYEAFRPYLSAASPFIVDIGAGQGGFLRWCRGETDADVAAVERSAACRTSMQGLGIPVYKDLADVDGRPDVIVCSHVLEHLWHPLAMLRAIAARMAPGTLLYVEVPNAAHELATADPWKRLYFEHVNHFDAAHLQDLLQAAGLQPILRGQSAFSPLAGEDGECLYAVCRKGPDREKEPSSDRGLAGLAAASLAAGPPPLRRIDAHPTGGIGIWGISQYAQLLLGTSPGLRERIRLLADASPAKQGRWLGDHRVGAPEALAALKADDLVLIPKGVYAPIMRERLGDMGFEGRVVEF